MKGLKLGSSRCECPTCGECFNSVYAFDRHRVPIFGGRPTDRVCLTPRQMRNYGMVENAAGYWVSAPSEHWRMD